jgi:hypothetical protein
MTKRLFTILTGLILFLFIPAAQAQLLVEDFDYPIGSLLINNGWTAHSGAGTQSIDVTTGLVFSGYKGSDIGGAANLDNNGEDVHRTFVAQTAGVVYVSAIVKIDANTTAGYFFHLGKVSIGTAYTSRVWVNSAGDAVGLGAGTAAPASYTPINQGTPFLIVLKHDFTDKKTSLFVLNSFAATEPGTPVVQVDETLTEIGSVALRQYHANQRIIVDGIRVATTWADAVAPAGQVTRVSTPNINPGGGSFTSPVQVAISSATEGAAIYYTTDGSDPDQSKTVYTGPITISSTTTLKVIAYKSGLDASSIAAATYTFPANVSNIAALREHSAGLYRLTGEAILTLKSSDRNAKYIQDATGAVLIDDPAGNLSTNYNVGDGISGITGTLGTYMGMLQFSPVVDAGAPTSTGNVVTPKALTLNEIANYPGQLVKVSGVTIDDEGQFVARTNYNLNGGNVQVLRTAYDDLPYIGTAIPQGPQDITGLVLIHNTTAQLVPRTAADIVPSVITDPTLVVSDVKALYGVNYGQSMKDTLRVNGYNLTGNVTISLTGTGAAAFSVSPSTLTPSNGSIDQALVEITFNPAAAGDHVATLTFASPGAADVVKTLNGKSFAMAGDGSIDNPFTVSDVLALKNSLAGDQKYWVKGYIMGSVGSGSSTENVLATITTAAPFANTSLAIATSANETTVASMVPVQLPLGAVRTALNLFDNPENLGKEIKVLGNLDAYFFAPGVRNVTEYAILTSLPAIAADRFTIVSQNGQLHITAVENASLEVYNTVGQLLYRGSLTKGHNQIDLRHNGVMIVKIDGGSLLVL